MPREKIFRIGFSDLNFQNEFRFGTGDPLLHLHWQLTNLQIFPEKTAGLSNGAYQHVPGGKRRAYTMKTTCTAGFTIERKVDPL